MNFKKTKVAVASGLMAASMVLAPLAAYADNWSEQDPALTSAKIVKTVKVADGVTIDADVTFRLTQIHNTKDGNDGVKAPNETVEKGSNGKDDYSFTRIEGISTGNNTNTVAAVDKTTNQYSVKALTKDHKDSDTDNGNKAGDNQYVATTALDFSEAKIGGELLDNGVYTFKIEETDEGLEKANPNGKEADSRYGWTMENIADSYILTVYVGNVNGKREVKYSVLQNKDNGVKKEYADFTNKFTKRGGSDVEGGASLVIKKRVDDTTYYAGQKFKFTISFEGIENLVDVTEAQAKNANFKDAEGNEISGRQVVDNGDETYTFELADDEYVEFPDIPAGARYTVTETERTNTSKTNVSTGSNMPEASSPDTQIIKKELITENANQGNFKNYLKNITVTGVVTHSAPFVIMVGALFVAVGGYVVLKKRIEE